jgi:hypothetical protein
VNGGCPTLAREPGRKTGQRNGQKIGDTCAASWESKKFDGYTSKTVLPVVRGPKSARHLVGRGPEIPISWRRERSVHTVEGFIVVEQAVRQRIAEATAQV